MPTAAATPINLIATYQQRLKLHNAHFSLIAHEDAMVAIVYKITQPDKAPLILKICTSTNDYLRELYFLSYFANTLPVPRIIQAVPPEEGLSGAILMECLPGHIAKIEDFTDTLSYNVGSMLARIHLNDTKGYGDLTQLQTLSSDPRAHFTLKFEEGIAECENHLPKTLIKECRDYYNAHLNLLSSVDGPCVVHRDFRPGNLIINNGELQGIIDWSSGRAGFAQEDFCSWEYAEWATDDSYKKSFLAGYASIRPIPQYHKMMPLLCLSKAIATIGFTVKRGTWNTTAAWLYQFNIELLESLLSKR